VASMEVLRWRITNEGRHYRKTRHPHIRVLIYTRIYISHLSSATLHYRHVFPVKLYVHDLSNGMVRAMSMQLVGRQIDSI
jgi:hypothetical protein